MLSTIAGWLSLATYLAFGWEPFRRLLTRVSKPLGDLIIVPLLAPYLLAVELRPDPGELLRLSVYLAIPTLLLRMRGGRGTTFGLPQFLAILAIWVPVELHLFTLLADLIAPGMALAARAGSLDLLPDVQVAVLSGLRIPIDTLTAVLLALTLFLVRHPVQGVGMTFSLNGADLRRAVTGLAAFAAVGIPLGLYTGFLRFGPSIDRPRNIALGLLGGYLFTALPEELLFRGLIQNLVTARIRNEWVGLLLAAAIFGLSHLNNATTGFGVPNWTYAAMAGLAGLAYGWVWLRSRKVTASAITHALVNGIWGVLFL